MKSRTLSFNRRRFISLTSAAVAGTGLAGLPVPKVRAAEQDHSLAANDRPTVALIGCGGRGIADARQSQDHCDIVALCDVDSDHLAKAKMQWTSADTYSDFRHVIERDDIDAIICGTQDHWHALITIAAMRSGKDVYCEKPLTLTIEEGQHLARVSRETKQIVQTGSQQRSDRRFRHACELVRNGRIGKLKAVQTFLPRGPRQGPFFETEIPKSLNWDRWLGPRAMTHYIKEKGHSTFRHWYDYSGGTMTDWGAHHNDIALWGIGLNGPTAIEGRPLVDMIPGGYTAASEYEVRYQYANGVVHTCRSVANSDPSGRPIGEDPQARGHGVLFEGTEGWIFVTRGNIESGDPDLLTTPLPDSAEKLYFSNSHHGNFFDCMRTREQPVANAEVGHRSASICHLGVIAIRTGWKLKWDPDRELITNNRAANDWLKRPMRGPWTFDLV